MYFIFDCHSIQPGYKPGLYVGHYDPSGDKPLGHFQLVICRNRTNKAAEDHKQT